MISKRSQIAGACILAIGTLTACGGGSDAGLSEGPLEAMSIELNRSGNLTVESGTRVLLTSKAVARLDSVTEHKWTIEKTSGADASAPTLLDPNCAGATTKAGKRPAGSDFGYNGSSTCSTYLVLPSDMKNSTWIVRSTAKSSTGSAAKAIELKVNDSASQASGFELQVPDVPKLVMLGETAEVSAPYAIAADAALSGKVAYQWKQVSGAAVALSGAQTSKIAFRPATAGEYVFSVKVTADINGRSEQREGFVVVSAQDSASFKSYNVSAGSLQAVTAGKTVKLQGVVTGTVSEAELSYQWQQVDGPSVKLFNEHTLAPEFVATEAGVYVFELYVTRQGSSSNTFKSAKTQVSVVAPVANAPVFDITAGDVQQVSPGATVSLTAALIAGNPAPTSVAYQWAQVDGPAQVALSNARSLKASFVPTVAGAYTFEVTAQSAGITQTATTQVFVASAPVAAFDIDAGALQAVTAPATVTLQGAASGSAQGLTYAWSQISGPPVELFSAQALSAQFQATAAGDYVFELTATRSGGAEPVVRSDRTKVSVSTDPTIGQPPAFAVSAGDAQVVETGKAVVLAGEVAVGTPAPSSMTYEWRQVSGPTVTLANGNTKKGSFVATEAGAYVFEFKVTVGDVSKTAMTSVSVFAPAAKL